jgi:dienelactone hydrolase
LLIGVYDIFGDTKNTHQFADLLASAYGFRIVIPDFFRGQPWEHTKWPPVPAEFQSWRDKITNWDTIVKYDIRAILNHYWTTFGIKDIGIFGFCWGGLVSTLAATHMPEIKAAGLIHPSFLTDDMAQGVKAPTYMFPCKNDPDLTPFYNVIRDKFGDNSGHRRYDDMCHGFSTSMGNFSNPLNFQRVEQTIDILGNFFQRNMPRLAKD